MNTEIQFNYKGHSVEISAAGHPQVQNIAIDGKPSGWVCFPNSSVNYAKQLIDNNATLETWQSDKI